MRKLFAFLPILLCASTFEGSAPAPDKSTIGPVIGAQINGVALDGGALYLQNGCVLSDAAGPVASISCPLTVTGDLRSTGAGYVSGVLDAGAIFTPGTLGVTGLVTFGGAENLNGVLDAGAVISQGWMIADSGICFDPACAYTVKDDTTNHYLAFAGNGTSGGVSITAGAAYCYNSGCSTYGFLSGSTLTFQSANTNFSGVVRPSGNTVGSVLATHYFDSTSTNTQYVQECGADAGVGGAMTVTLHFASGTTPKCTCSDVNAAVHGCGLSAQPTNTNVVFEGNGTDTIQWCCTGAN